MPELKVCQFCQSDINVKAIICPVCKSNVAPSKQKFLIFAFSIIITVLVYYAGYIFLFSGDNSLFNQFAGHSTDPSIITLAEFNEITIGMSYNQIAKIIGSEGEVTSQFDIMGVRHTTMSWRGGSPVSSAIFQFEGSVCTSKHQLGLE